MNTFIPGLFYFFVNFATVVITIIIVCYIFLIKYIKIFSLAILMSLKKKLKFWLKQKNLYQQYKILLIFLFYIVYKI